MPENSKAGSKVFQVEAHDPDDPNTAEVKKKGGTGTRRRNIWTFSPLVPSKQEKNMLSLSQFVYFLREVCLLFNFD